MREDAHSPQLLEERLLVFQAEGVAGVEQREAVGEFFEELG